MSFDFLDHTADIAVRVRAASLDALFAEAALALTATFLEAGEVKPAVRRDVALASTSPELLLVDWLNDLVYRFDVERLLVARAEVRVTEERGTWCLDAAVFGEALDRTRHHARVPIKGVTYHQLAIAETDGELETTVVFDI